MTAAQHPEQVLFGERGTVMPHPEKPHTFWVKGTETTYEVFLKGDTGFCECPGYRYRQRCSHLQAVRLYLWQQRACPCCGGKGWMHAHPGSGLRYVRRDGSFDEGPWPLGCCCGTGLRSQYERNASCFLPGEWEHLYCPRPALPEPTEAE